MPIHLVIEAGRTERQYWRDLWRYRELFYFLAWRDFLVRYKQTAVGVAWALIRPILTILILSLACKAGTALRHAAVAVFFHRHVREWQQPRE